MKAAMTILLGVLTSASIALAKGDPTANRKQFIDTCTKAYQDLTEANLKMSRSSTKEVALDRCNTAARPTDDMKSWDIMDDKELGCDIGVRMVLKDYPKLGSAKNLSDWKKYYGAACGNW